MIGLQNLSKRLQLIPDLKHKKATEMARSSEQIKSQMEEIHEKNVDEIKTQKKYKIKKKKWKQLQ